MKKLNEKGLSIIELLVCFVIVAVVAITLLNTLMEYKTEEEIENVKNHVESYKNTVTRVIQSDITDYALIGYGNKTYTATNGKYTLSVKLIFEKPFKDGSTEKTLVIFASDKENYILYPDVVEQNGSYIKQDVKYELEANGIVLDTDPEDESSTQKKEYNDLRFAYLNEDLIRVKNGNTISIDIPITHSELGDSYHIKIVAPLALLSSVTEKEATECTLYYYSGETSNTTCTPASLTRGIGERWGQLCNTLKKNGYQLNGWSTNDSCSGKKIEATDQCSTTTATIYAYPCWEAKKYTLTLIPNGGTYTGATTRTMTYGKKTNNNIGKVTPPTGYTFHGWRTSGGTLVYDSSGKNIKNTTYWTNSYSTGTWKYEGDLTLYAILTPKTTTITLNKNGGTSNASPTTVTATYNSSTLSPSSLTSLPEKKYTVTLQNTGSTSTRKTNKLSFTTRQLISAYTFGGWSVAPRESLSTSPKVLNNAKSLAFEKNVSNLTSSTGTWISKSNDMTFYAIWTGGRVTLPTVTQAGYTCGFTNSDTGTTIKYTGSYTPTSDTTLYPVCVPNTYTLNYNKNGGSGSCSSKTETYGSVWGTLCSGVTKEGYNFENWVNSADTSTRIKSSSTVTGNVTALANWSYCEPVGNWSNVSSKIKIYQSYTKKSHYRKVTKENENAAFTEVVTNKTWTSDAFKHYKFHYKADDSSYAYHWCYSKYDKLSPTRPYIDNVHADSPSTSVESTCTKNTVACAITVTTTGVDHYDIGWSYHYGDQGSTYESGSSGVRYIKKEYHYSDKSTCTETMDIKTNKWDKTCDDSASIFDYYTIDEAGNRSEAETVSIWWTKK